LLLVLLELLAQQSRVEILILFPFALLKVVEAHLELAGHLHKLVVHIQVMAVVMVVVALVRLQLTVLAAVLADMQVQVVQVQIMVPLMVVEA
jgi:hypothetical protein